MESVANHLLNEFQPSIGYVNINVFFTFTNSPYAKK